MSTTTRITVRVGLAAATLLSIVPAATAAGGRVDRQSNDPHLAGRAVLPAETLAPGPPSGAFAPPSPRPPVTFPTASQPVEGFSGIVSGRRPGEYLAMPDNGFGSKDTSSDFLIRAYYVTPDFKTARGGSGTVAVGDFVSFADPDQLMPFPLVRPDRLLTGADIDPESIQRDQRGDLWVGDEFGPWILHFDDTGRLLEPPIALADELRSPNNPAGGTTVANSRGLEAMAIAPNGQSLVLILEGALTDATDRLGRRIYRYDIGTGAFTRLADYRVTAGSAAEADARFVSDAQMIDSHRLLVIERDGGSGAAANYRRVYEIDLDQVGADGAVAKRQVVDLAAIADPDLVSLPEIHPGDVGIGEVFRVTCESIEALHVTNRSELLLGCDNNLPNAGRNPGRADDNEFIVVKVPGF